MKTQTETARPAAPAHDAAGIRQFVRQARQRMKSWDQMTADERAPFVRAEFCSIVLAAGSVNPAIAPLAETYREMMREAGCV